MSANKLPYRDMLTILEHVARCLGDVAIVMRDRPESFSEDHIREISLAIQRLEALKGAGL